MKLSKLFKSSKANPHDKSSKLPKYRIDGVNQDGTIKRKKLWVKGKSKFLHIRLFEEGKEILINFRKVRQI